VVVTFIPQIGPPQVVDLHPVTEAEKRFEQPPPLAGIQRTLTEQGFPAQDIFVLQERRMSHNRLEKIVKTGPEHFAIQAFSSHQRTDNHVGIDHNARGGHNRDDSIYAITQRDGDRGRALDIPAGSLNREG